jgi:hypothetical protein
VALAAIRDDQNDGLAHVAMTAAVLKCENDDDEEFGAIEAAKECFPLSEGWRDHSGKPMRIKDAIIDIERPLAVDTSGVSTEGAAWAAEQAQP